MVAARATAGDTWIAEALWAQLFGDLRGYLCVASSKRTRAQLADFRERYFAYPQTAGMAADFAQAEDRRGREVYFCAHLLTERKRDAAHAALVGALWADYDGAQPPCAAGDLAHGDPVAQQITNHGPRLPT